MLLLTDEEIQGAITFRGTLPAPNWNPYDEVAKAQLKKVVEYVEKEGTTAYIYEGEYTYETKCDNVIILDLGDWQKEIEE